MYIQILRNWSTYTLPLLSWYPTWLGGKKRFLKNTCVHDWICDIIISNCVSEICLLQTKRVLRKIWKSNLKSPLLLCKSQKLWKHWNNDFCSSYEIIKSVKLYIWRISNHWIRLIAKTKTIFWAKAIFTWTQKQLENPSLISKLIFRIETNLLNWQMANIQQHENHTNIVI